MEDNNQQILTNPEAREYCYALLSHKVLMELELIAVLLHYLVDVESPLRKELLEEVKRVLILAMDCEIDVSYELLLNLRNFSDEAD